MMCGRMGVYLSKVLVIEPLEQRHLAQLLAGRLDMHEGARKVQLLLLPLNQVNDLLNFCFIHQTCTQHEWCQQHAFRLLSFALLETLYNNFLMKEVKL